MDESNEFPNNSLRAQQEAAQAKESHTSERAGITMRKKGIGSFFRQMVKRGDMDSITNIFGNAMINAVADAIDEVTGNLTHRAKSILYDTEDYDRGRKQNSGGGYRSYSKYYDDRNGRNSRPSGSSSPRGSVSTSRDDSDRTPRKWQYNEVFFDQRIFGGKSGAEKAAWRVIRKMDEQITDPDSGLVSIADFYRFCLEEDDQNPHIQPEYTDERWGWDKEEAISNLHPIAVPGGYIIELPQPKSFYS